MKAPLPPDEAQRLQALRSYEILDTPPDQALDDITLLASRICGTPIAMISLVDEHRQWFKSKIGLTETETSRDAAFCAHGILQAGVFVVKDALTDARFADNPLVTGGPGIRFYAGAPLRTSDGHALGMICVNDRVPRELSSDQLEALQALSRQVVVQFELKRGMAELNRTVAQLNSTRELLQLLYTAAEQAKDALVITDAELDFPGPKIVFVNPAFTKMTGYSAEEILGKTPRLLQGPKTNRAVLEQLRQKLERGELFEGETINYRKDGTEFDLEWQVAPIRDSNGEITHFLAVQRDVTERRQIEARMLQAQKMETVGKLAGGVAHEFNSILTAIIGQSEILAAGISPDDPRSGNAQEIRGAAERAAVLTRQLLAYGSRQMLQPEVIDLNEVLFRMQGTLQHLVGPGVTVRVLPGPDLKWVKIDPGQMEQVIVNLAINAAEAMPRGGVLTLETANVMMDEDYVGPLLGLKAGGYVRLAVSDTGEGMSDEVKARAFEPFFTTKGPGQGAGLGLSSCYGIIKQSDGHINLYSEIGRGTTVKIYLPQGDIQGSVVRPSITARELPRGTETILLVEDDESFSEMAAALLRRLGYAVFTAADGEEALALARQPGIGKVDLLFTDVVLPHLGGRELADRVREIQPGVRILFTTAYTEGAIADQGVLEKGVALLQKPFTPSALAGKVREVLDKPITPRLP